MNKKKFFKKLINISRPIILLFLSLFFEKKYLNSHHFLVGYAGYKWAFRSIWQRSILRLGPSLPFPASVNCFISNTNNLKFHPDDLNNFQTNGTYFQNMSAYIVIGKGSFIAPNVGLITANHNPSDLNEHLPSKDVIIGNNCWIGMNSVILPGVEIASNTIVAAGSVVTKSFLEGACMIGGTPAKTIKKL